MAFKRTVKFLGYNCYLEYGYYANGRTAIRLVDIDEDEAVATPTVDLPDVELKEDEVAIKDYSENEGILEVLVTAGIVSFPIRFEKSGWVEVPICKLLIDPKDE